MPIPVETDDDADDNAGRDDRDDDDVDDGHDGGVVPVVAAVACVVGALIMVGMGVVRATVVAAAAVWVVPVLAEMRIRRMRAENERRGSPTDFCEAEAGRRRCSFRLYNSDVSRGRGM